MPPRRRTWFTPLNATKPCILRSNLITSLLLQRIMEEHALKFQDVPSASRFHQRSISSMNPDHGAFSSNMLSLGTLQGTPTRHSVFGIIPRLSCTPQIIENSQLVLENAKESLKESVTSLGGHASMNEIPSSKAQSVAVSSSSAYRETKLATRIISSSTEGKFLVFISLH